MLFIEYVQGFLKTLINLGSRRISTGKWAILMEKTGHFDGKLANFGDF